MFLCLAAPQSWPWNGGESQPRVTAKKAQPKAKKIHLRATRNCFRIMQPFRNRPPIPTDTLPTALPLWNLFAPFPLVRLLLLTISIDVLTLFRGFSPFFSDDKSTLEPHTHGNRALSCPSLSGKDRTQVNRTNPMPRRGEISGLSGHYNALIRQVDFTPFSLKDPGAGKGRDRLVLFFFSKKPNSRITDRVAHTRKAFASGIPLSIFVGKRRRRFFFHVVLALCVAGSISNLHPI